MGKKNVNINADKDGYAEFRDGVVSFDYGLVGGLEEVVEKASNSEGTNTAHYWGNGGEIFSGV